MGGAVGQIVGPLAIRIHSCALELQTYTRPPAAHQPAIAMSQRRIFYFDNNATTRVAPEVVEAMTPFFTER